MMIVNSQDLSLHWEVKWDTYRSGIIAGDNVPFILWIVGVEELSGGGVGLTFFVC